jgi:integrase
MRGDGRVFKRGARWWISYYAPGTEGRSKEFREPGGDKEAEARRLLRHRLREVGAHNLGLQPFLGPQQERIRVNELLNDLITRYRMGGKKRIPREVNAPMLSHLKRVRDYFGGMWAVAVNQRHVEDFISLLKGKNYANATINRATQLLGQAFAIAAAATPPKVLRPLKIEKLDESDNVRKGKFTEREAEAVASSLPVYMSDAARFAYQTGSRAGEILKLRWDYLDHDAITVPGKIAKNRTARSIALTPELEEIIARRRAARVEGCNLIFHHDGRPIGDYRKCWQTACLVNGLGRLYCRDCRDEDGNYSSVLDIERRCARCGRKCEGPKYVGRLFHDFRRSAAHEMWLGGSTTEDCRKVTGHKTDTMFLRYADLFSEPEIRSRQREVQRRRREWRQAEAELVPARAAGAQEPAAFRRVQ